MGFPAHLAGSTYVAPAGDLNGDGRADLVIELNFPRATALRVVFGRRLPGILKLDSASARSLPIVTYQGHRFGSSFGSAGDVSGDGIGDLIAASDSSPDACVLFGRRGAWPHTNVCGGKHGFRIVGDATIYPGGVGSAGDIDGDGFGDLLVSAPGDTVAGGGQGAVYLVYGRQTTTTVDLQTDDRLVRVTTQPPGLAIELIGGSMAAPGDVSGDGQPDIVIGAADVGTAWLISSALR